MNTNSLKQISVLINNQFSTTDASNMWMTSYNQDHPPIIIEINFAHQI